MAPQNDYAYLALTEREAEALDVATRIPGTGPTTEHLQALTRVRRKNAEALTRLRRRLERSNGGARARTAGR